MSTTALPAYLIMGDDQAKRERNRQRFIDRMAEVGSVDFDCTIMDASTHLVIDDLISALNICPALSPYRLVVLDNVDALSAEDLKPICAYLDDPCPSSILLMTAVKIAKNTRLYKRLMALGKSALILCEQPKEYQLHTRVREMAPTFGITIDEAGAKALVSAVGTSTVMLCSELERLALLMGTGAQITREVIETHLVRSTEVNPWKLIDSIFLRQRVVALSNIALVHEKQIAFILMRIAARLRELITVKSMTNAGQAALLGSVLKMDAWRLRNLQTQAACFSLEELERGLSKTAQADQRFKSGYPKQAVLIDLVADLLSSKANNR